MIRNRHLFQSETALKESIIVPKTGPPPPSQQKPKPRNSNPSEKKNNNPLKLPPLPSQLLITAYLASHTHPKNDTLLFSKYSSRQKRRRRGPGGGASAFAPTTPSKKQ
ncbi:MAG: hypothetical protein Q9222_006272, partial [Ikaeria aurantiellina]